MNFVLFFPFPLIFSSCLFCFSFLFFIYFLSYCPPSSFLFFFSPFLHFYYRVALKKFSKFENTADALESATALVEGKLSKDLKSFLKKNIVSADLKDQLAVTDPRLASVINEKLGIKVHAILANNYLVLTFKQCLYNSNIQELTRGIRLQLTNLIAGMSESDVKAMSLGLSHSLSRYKLKFSPDKVDTMIVQAVCTSFFLPI